MINIADFLPHAAPFILPDKVLDVELEKGQIRTQKKIEEGDYFLNGHFEKQPVFPGVMIIETMAQSAGVLLSMTYEPRTMFLAKVSDVRFRSVVRPGDCLEIFVQVEKSKGRIWTFFSEVKKGEELVASSSFTLALEEK